MNCSNSTPGLISDAKCQQLIKETQYSQPLCTAIQIALVNYLNRCNARPIAVIGHSSGEIAAAYAAEAITAAEAVAISYFKGLALSQASPGSMAAVGLGREQVVSFLCKGVVIACYNTENSVTLSGDSSSLESVLESITMQLPGTFVRRLNIDRAFHSRMIHLYPFALNCVLTIMLCSAHMHEIGTSYLEMLMPWYVERDTALPFYSTVYGAVQNTIRALYWKENLERPVLFKQAMYKLLDDLKRPLAFIEIGMHSALKGPIRHICDEHSKLPAVYIPTLTSGTESTVAMAAAIGRLFVHGFEPDFSTINPNSGILVDLPNYSWDHSSEYWRESRLSKTWRHKAYPNHDLLGSRCLESSDLQPAWRNILGTEAVPWINDHRLYGNVVFPAAGYIAMIGEAIRQVTGSENYSVRGMTIEVPMLLESNGTIEIVTSMRRSHLSIHQRSPWFNFSIISQHGSTWTQHCTAEGRPGNSDHHAPGIRKIDPLLRPVSAELWYKMVASLGLDFGPSFQTLSNVTTSPTENSATATIRAHHIEGRSTYAAHPTVIDACLQLSAVASVRGIDYELDTLLVPSFIDYVTVKPSSDELVASASTRITDMTTEGSVTARTRSGESRIYIYGVTSEQLDRKQSAGSKLKSSSARLEWRPDINYSEPSKFIRPPNKTDLSFLQIEKITCLCILRTLDVLKTLPPSNGHLAKQNAWLEEEMRGMKDGTWANMVPEAQTWAHLDPDARESILESTLGKIQASENHQIGRACQTLKNVSNFQSTQDIFTGKKDPIHVLVEDGGLANLYDLSDNTASLKNLLSLYAHARPTLRVLEIGAGTGGTTINVLQALTSEENVRMYSEYVFTDISSGFFTAAEKRLAEYGGVQYRKLDITESPSSQGFEENYYDLILATNVSY